MQRMADIRIKAQVLVLGGGIAGSTAALTLADMGLDVLMVTASAGLDSGNTALAQGGIVFTGQSGDVGSLEKDIMTAGRMYNYRKAVRHLCRRGASVVQSVLMDRLDVPFARSGAGGDWDLGLEGGHGVHRILHCGDYTGQVIMEALSKAVRASANVRILPGRTAVDLITSRHHSKNMEFRYQLGNCCAGAYVFNELTGEVETILADYTIMATGGVGQVYLHTTNPPSSTGAGLNMAQRARAAIANAEFVQFHPTTIYHRSERRLLITEALRGEGARLVNGQGEAFMSRYDPAADLAPRDVVSRAILQEMQNRHEDCVYLDATMIPAADLEKRFPTVSSFCRDIGLDLSSNLIPVVPAAHYFCGGVLVDLQGKTTIDRLYAVGECSCTGVHGANRLASTSLLEGLLWGYESARDVAARSRRRSSMTRLHDSVDDWVAPGDSVADMALIAQDWSALRHTMWNYVGITRSSSRLHRAFEDLRFLTKNVTDFYKKTTLSKPLVDLFHGCQTAYIISIAALLNKKSVGCHYRID